MSSDPLIHLPEDTGASPLNGIAQTLRLDADSDQVDGSQRNKPKARIFHDLKSISDPGGGEPRVYLTATAPIRRIEGRAGDGSEESYTHWACSITRFSTNLDTGLPPSGADIGDTVISDIANRFHAFGWIVPNHPIKGADDAERKKSSDDRLQWIKSSAHITDSLTGHFKRKVEDKDFSRDWGPALSQLLDQTRSKL